VTDRPTATVLRRRDLGGAIYICSNCQGVVGASDSYCRHCGARLLGVKA
jgi:predicted amidophosphoribosyltransferase